MTTFFDLLSRRKLVPWTLAYLGGAWVVLQVLGEAADAFALAPVVLRVGWLLLGIGFITTLVLAWFHGETGVQRVSSPELLLLAGLLILAGAGVRWIGRDAGATPAAAPEPIAPVEPGSIAVLPFSNLSESKENEYFSYGMTEEILMTLASIDGLRVTNGASVMQYMGTTKPAQQIAAELGVAHLLTGSVQRGGDRVRIRVQLISARNDTPLWVERYDRPLTDILAVQSEIAHEIATALRVSLDAGERARIERRPTTNLLAYDYVLRAQHLMLNPEPQSHEAALGLIREALKLDPSYADAFAARASALRGLYYFRGEATWLDSAVVAARRAIALEPSSARGYAQLGSALGLRGEREASLEAHLQAVKLNPTLVTGLANRYDFDFGRLDEAARLWGRVLETDPTNAPSFWMAGRTYLHLGMPERARALFERAKKLAPGFIWASYSISLAFLAEGRQEEARAEVWRMLAETRDSPEALLWAGQIMAALGDLPAARRYFEHGLTEATSLWEKEHAALTLAWILQHSGETEPARLLLQEASRGFETRRRGQRWRPEDHAQSARLQIVAGDREGAIRAMREAVRLGWRLYANGLLLINSIPGDPVLGSLRGDPGFERLMAEVKADVDRQRERVEREGW